MFITNNANKNLKERLIELIKNSTELNFLIGFFYFSGIKEVYDGLKSNPDAILKILVGLDVDIINDKIIEVTEEYKLNNSDNFITDNFMEQIKTSINTDDFDLKEFYEQSKFFIEQIKNDKIIIRKTRKPNHSKLYIFNLKESQIARNALFITGSSNLTKAGLSLQDEFNVEISDYGIDEVRKYFQNLWNESIKINEIEEYKEKLIITLENLTHLKKITPFEAYCYVLKTYLDAYKIQKIDDYLVELLIKKGYEPYKYQLDAVSQAVSIIEQHNGVILADVVGLGKTIIACLIAKKLGKRGIVICPPGLIGDDNCESGWMKYLNDFELYNWIPPRSVGIEKLKEACEFVKKHNDIEVIIIDEAHRFRNQDTEGYEILKNICRNKKVILLTATPFNNRPGDILSLLKLFITPKISSITLKNDLEAEFDFYRRLFDKLSYIKRYHNSKDEDKKERAKRFYISIFGVDEINLKKVKERVHQLAIKIRNVIEPVTIRRNRLDLQKNPYYSIEINKLSKVEKPIEGFYELTKEQSRFYDKIIEKYFGDPDDGCLFTGAIYMPFIYEYGDMKTEELFLSEDEIADENKKELNREYNQQRNLYDFMRSLLVKRFESSFGAFEKSIKNFKHKYEIVLEFIKKTGKYILDRELIEKIYELDIEEIEKELKIYAENLKMQVLPKKHKIYKIKDFKKKDKFIDDIKSDIKLFEDILKELKKLDLINNDPKLESVIKELKKTLNEDSKKGEPKRKVVVFTEFIDTANYIKERLEKEFKNRVLTIAGDLSLSKIKHIYENFDAAYKDQKDEYDILLTTDKLSEGFNLNRAGKIINYDIPWNPVRVIQRLGRINRISKKVFDKLYIINFFPTETGAEYVRSKEIAQNKMFMIHKTIGEDARIFTEDEEPTPSELYNRINTNPEETEEESFYTKIINKYKDIENKYPEIIEKIKDFPTRIKVSKNSKEFDELIVILKKYKLYCMLYDYKTKKIEEVDLEQILNKIECSIDEKSNEIDDRFWQAYEEVKKSKDIISIKRGEESLYKKALNKLDYLINLQNIKLEEHKNFLRILREDILDYGTLPIYTLRRIVNLKGLSNIDRTIEDIKELKTILGDNYLEKEKIISKIYKKEIIIAIENKLT